MIPHLRSPQKQASKELVTWRPSPSSCYSCISKSQNRTLFRHLWFLLRLLLLLVEAKGGQVKEADGEAGQLGGGQGGLAVQQEDQQQEEEVEKTPVCLHFVTKHRGHRGITALFSLGGWWAEKIVSWATNWDKMWSRPMFITARSHPVNHP